MVQVLHPILSSAPVYKLAMNLLGRSSAQEFHVTKHIRARAGDKIIDLGCGPCEYLNCLPAVDYIGIDFEPNYIDDAKKKFGNKGTFVCQNIADLQPNSYSDADIVITTGVLHHLDDDQASHLLELARSFLKPDGRFISYDGCFLEEDQHPIDRWMLDNDRGKFVRKKSGYVNLAREKFSIVDAYVYSDLLRIPYTIIVMECSMQKPSR
jgi:SAM-dependent methyltransferase